MTYVGYHTPQLYTPSRSSIGKPKLNLKLTLPFWFKAERIGNREDHREMGDMVKEEKRNARTEEGGTMSEDRLVSGDSGGARSAHQEFRRTLSEDATPPPSEFQFQIRTID